VSFKELKAWLPPQAAKGCNACVGKGGVGLLWCKILNLLMSSRFLLFTLIQLSQAPSLSGTIFSASCKPLYCAFEGG